jgi:hypothetical protein
MDQRNIVARPQHSHYALCGRAFKQWIKFTLGILDRLLRAEALPTLHHHPPP